MFDILPKAISSFAFNIDSLLIFIYYITGFFFFLLEGYLLYLVLRYRKNRGAVARYEPGEKWVQIQWIVVFTLVVVILDFFIDYKGAPIWAAVKEEMPTCEVTVKVVAKQFDWTFIYPDKDGRFDTPGVISSYRELHVPVGKKIQVILTSKDVIHELSFPKSV